MSSRQNVLVGSNVTALQSATLSRCKRVAICQPIGGPKVPNFLPSPRFHVAPLFPRQSRGMHQPPCDSSTLSRARDRARFSAHHGGDSPSPSPSCDGPHGIFFSLFVSFYCCSTLCARSSSKQFFLLHSDRPCGRRAGSLGQPHNREAWPVRGHRQTPMPTLMRLHTRTTFPMHIAV